MGIAATMTASNSSFTADRTKPATASRGILMCPKAKSTATAATRPRRTRPQHSSVRCRSRRSASAPAERPNSRGAAVDDAASRPTSNASASISAMARSGADSASMALHVVFNVSDASRRVKRRFISSEAKAMRFMPRLLRSCIRLWRPSRALSKQNGPRPRNQRTRTLYMAGSRKTSKSRASTGQTTHTWTRPGLSLNNAGYR